MVGNYFMRTNLHDFYTRLKTRGACPIMMYSGVNPKTGENRPSGPKATPQQMDEPYLPGGIPRTADNPTEFLGLALFKGDRMVGTLNNDETRAVALLQSKLHQGFVGVVDPLQAGKCDTKSKSGTREN